MIRVIVIGILFWLPFEGASQCLITNLTTNIGSCEAISNSFDVSGSVEFINAPTSGTLNITVDNGISTFDSIISMPFVSPTTFTVSNIPSDGSTITISATFSSNSSCTISSNGTAPTSCECNVSIGTFTETMTGQSQNNYVLCYGDELQLTANGDWNAPDEMFNPPANSYDPGIGWIIYSCEPTIGLTPNLTTGIFDDPCFLGLLGYGDQTIVNDMSLINLFTPGTFIDNKVYIMPLTMYSMADGYYSYVNGGNLPCYDVGPVYTVQFLPSVNIEAFEDCYSGTYSAALFGGSLPEIDSSLFTLGNLYPSTASFVNTTAVLNGEAAVTGLLDGDSLYFTVTDNNGCFIELGTPYFSGKIVADIISSNIICEDLGTSVIVPQNSGGVFTGNCGSCIDSSGNFDPSISGLGSFNITYEISSACGDTSNFYLTVSPREDASFMLSDFCPEDPIPAAISGVPGGVFSLLNAPFNNEYIDSQTGEIFNAENDSLYGVIYTTNGICTNMDTSFVSAHNAGLCPVVVNNVFSPDGDNVNDFWTIPTFASNKDNRVVIYNRWGDILREFNNYNNIDVVWDGKNKTGNLVENGTYFYVVEVPESNYGSSGWIQVIK